jgi:cyclomaltodextrinase / maltogenic alpha-amylase / neopullulanase
MEETNVSDPPIWAQEAIWYQIFPERFRRGNPYNDPTHKTMEGAIVHKTPDDWGITPWGHDWYKQEEWAVGTGLDFNQTSQMRRYGGDLQGVIDQIPYLIKLGITAIYFNPLNDAPSLHKYDARNYHHIDVSFGNDRDGDLEIIHNEDKENPVNWVWTNADLLFLELIKKLHDVGIKIILDFSFNHTGSTFWAFEDVLKKGNESSYKDWYKLDFIDPKTNESFYHGWNGISTLPEINKHEYTKKINGYPYEGDIAMGIKEHIFNVCKRWIDPYENGDLNSGIDGLRLDVADQIPLDFWRELRTFTKKLKPDFFLVGEIWWIDWPHQLMDAEPWVRGDIFDAVMHYQWLDIAINYFTNENVIMPTDELIESYRLLLSKYKPSTQNAMMNLLSSHDTERIATALCNSNKYKFKSKPLENPLYYVQKPTQLARAKLMVLLLHQFTFVGAPHIWNGDEMGMWGADDPDNRKPLLWPDMEFEPETYPYSIGQLEMNDLPKFDEQLFNFFKQLCQLRKSNMVLSKGDITFDNDLSKIDIFCYVRQWQDVKIRIILNVHPTDIFIPIGKTEILFNLNCNPEELGFTFQPYSGLVIKLNT